MTHARGGLVLICFGLAIPMIGGANPFFSTLDDVVPFVRVGVSVRSISVDFSTDPSRVGVPADVRGATFGPGDVGVYRGGDEAVEYENGQVGVDRGDRFQGGSTGDALTIIDAASQLSESGRFLGRFPIRQVSFNSNESTLDRAINAPNRPVQTSTDREVSVGPLVELVFPVQGFGDGSSVFQFMNAVVGYSYHSSSHDSGTFGLGRQRVGTTDTSYTYSYDYFGTANPVTSSFPFDGTGANGGGVVYDPSLFASSPMIDFPNPDLESPRTGRTSSRGTAVLPVFLTTNVNLKLHELPFGLEVGSEFGDRGQTRIALTGGGTVNIVDLDVTTQTDWFQPGGAVPIATSISSYSSQPVKLGGYVGLNVTHALNASGSVYLHAHATYRWVDGITAKAGASQVDLDLSSFEGGVGIGFLLE